MCSTRAAEGNLGSHEDGGGTACPQRLLGTSDDHGQPIQFGERLAEQPLRLHAGRNDDDGEDGFPQNRSSEK